MRNPMGQLDDHVTTIIKKLLNEEFDISQLKIGHVCFRVHKNNYSILKEHIERHSNACLKNDMQVRNKLITVYQLRFPHNIIMGNHTFSISVIEIVQIADGEKHSQGWEHIEFVAADKDALYECYKENSHFPLNEHQTPYAHYKLELNNVGKKNHSINLKFSADPLAARCAA